MIAAIKEQCLENAKLTSNRIFISWESFWRVLYEEYF